MNRKLAIALVLAAAAAGNAFADDITVETVAFKSTATRADVQAQYVAERAAVAAMTREDSGAAYLAGQDAQDNAASPVAAAPATRQQ